MKPWYQIENVGEVASPSLLVYPDRVEENIRRMIVMAGGVERLRPHVKTHKLGEVVRMQMAMGLTKFKTATIAETEMVASCGARDVLLAYQPVGPNLRRLVQLVRMFPETRISCVADDAGAIRVLAREFAAAGLSLEVLLDLDCGMHRTGVAPGAKAVELYRLLAGSGGLKPGGLHAYDGHIHQPGLSERTLICDQTFGVIRALRQELESAGLPVPRVVAGGTPTFPIHARRLEVECSPGTCIFWDCGYGAKFSDMDFLPAALVLTRVVSKPGPNALCLDLGHKAIAAENPHPRVQLFDLTDANFTTHSEEHLVIETVRAADFAVGDVLYGIPHHICPTVALHGEAVVIERGRATARWKIGARNRTMTI